MSYMNKMKGKFLEVSFRIIAANLRYLMIVDLLDQLKESVYQWRAEGRAGVIFPASSGLMKVNERRKVIKIADGSVLFEDFDQFILLFPDVSGTLPGEL